MTTGAMIAILFAAAFAFALALRAWQNTNRILAERRMAARLRQVADYLAEQQELDRLVNAAVLEAHRAYDEYRGEVR